MRALTVIIALIMLAMAAATLAEVCVPSGWDYTRSYRPQGHTPNYHPIGDEHCLPYNRDTYATNTPLCFTCHPHKSGGSRA